MKRYLLLLISFVTFLSSHAQTQIGYVKTKGRLTTNGTVIHGERLNGATISLTNRNVVTKGKGDFSFPIGCQPRYAASMDGSANPPTLFSLPPMTSNLVD